jgi:hypothetical protein
VKVSAPEFGTFSFGIHKLFGGHLMKHRVAQFAFVLTLVCTALTSAHATTVTIKFTGPETVGGTPVAYGGFYVGIYKGTINGKSAQFVCDDFLSEISGGQSWSAIVGQTNLVSSTVKFNPPSSFITNPLLIPYNLNLQELYNMITYLSEKIITDPNPHADWGYESWAIWSTTDSAWSYHSGLYYTSQVKAYVQDALNHRDTFNGNLPVYTPNPTNSGQEFVGASEAGTTPLLVVATLFGGLFLKRSRFGVRESLIRKGA